MVLLVGLLDCLVDVALENVVWEIAIYCDEMCRTKYSDCCSDVPQKLHCPGKFHQTSHFDGKLRLDKLASDLTNLQLNNKKANAFFLVGHAEQLV